MRVGFHTFGCKLNQYETEALAEPFQERGFTVVPASSEAELYLINTCTVTTRADHKARALIRGLSRRRPGALIVVTGCGAELEADELAALGANVLVVAQNRKALLLELPRLLAEARAGGAGAGGAGSVQALLAGSLSRAARTPDPFAFQARRLSFHTRAFLKIQDGCDSRCSYCRVPLARGASQALDADLVIARARELEALGHREIVITGVNISSYLCRDVDLSRLVKNLLSQTARVRLRLSSLEPERIGDGLLEAAAHPRVCSHFHIAVQSGSDTVLARMRRRYTSMRVMDAVSRLREVKADPFIAADILVGFPGETGEDFAGTRELVRPERIRAQRAAELGALSRVLDGEYAARWIGRDVEVLLQKRRRLDSGGHTGVTSNYLKVRVEGLPPGLYGGRIARARIISATDTGSKVPGKAVFLAFQD
jgi:threonylcarbamoyladenosine tRNA methylthiotransferase MtaB